MNREITSTLWPFTGDAVTQAGSPTVTVVGINNVPVQAVTMQGGEYITYDPNNAYFIPKLRATIQVNNLTVSDDAEISVNVAKPVKVNGA